MDINKELPPKALTKKVFLWMMDSSTIDYLYRKLPKEIIESNSRQDGVELSRLQEYGVHFTCDITLAAKALQALAFNFVFLQQEDERTREATCNILLDGLVNQIVDEVRDGSK